jgi:hypothetical protein
MLETGRSEPELETIIKLARAAVKGAKRPLGVPLVEFQP